MPSKHLSTGQLGENIACHYLKKKGYTIVARNYTNSEGVRLGEIDIIALYKGRIVFVEVKTRIERYTEELPPEANINRDKLRKLTRIANVYLRSTRQQDRAYGFDAISVLINETDGKARIRHLPDIFL